MAIRRMLSKNICETDRFLAMPASSQCLYFHFNMCADDDGFVSNPNTIKKLVNASDDDLNLLIIKNYIIPFASGIVVITDWFEHNQIRKDRYKQTKYIDELKTLNKNEQNKYILTCEQPAIRQVATKWQPNGNQVATQVRLGKDSLGEEDDDVQKLLLHNADVNALIDIEKYQYAINDFIKINYEAYRNDELVKKETIKNIELLIETTNGYSERNINIINGFSDECYRKIYRRIEEAMIKAENGQIDDIFAFISCYIKNLINKNDELN